MFNKGFQIKFENEVCVSVQFGPGSYCEHYDALNYKNGFKEPKKKDVWESKDAEIAIWTESAWITHEFAEQVEWAETYEDWNVQVLPEATPVQVLEALNWAEHYGCDKDETD
ncbi:MAG: hypothetical protein ACOCTM_04275 [Bacteroidota bacterium]